MFFKKYNDNNIEIKNDQTALTINEICDQRYVPYLTNFLVSAC